MPLAYSGAGSPLLLALAYPALEHDFAVQTAVLVGAPFFDVDTNLKAGSLKRIVNIYGSDDLGLRTSGSLPHIAKKFTHSEHSFETINIELKDIHHVEYFYQNGENPTPEQKKASSFIARLTQAALDSAELERVLVKFNATLQEQTYVDPNTNISHHIRTYIIDTKNIPDNL